MRRKMQIVWIFALISFLWPVMVFAAEVNLSKTGQTTCYNEYGSVIDCTGTGQDGDTQAGVEWPEPRFEDNGDGTVTDNLTGLIWLKNANCGGEMTVPDALAYCNNLAGGSCGLTDGSSAGDWRLPNIIEIESLINAEEDNPGAWLNTQGFTNVKAYGVAQYHSATTHANVMNATWSLNMEGGVTNYHEKSSSLYVWPVRDGQSAPAQIWQTGQETCYDVNGNIISCTGTGQDGDIQAGVAWPSPRFTDNGDGTVTDNVTGLIWLQDANCGGTMTWTDALSYCNNLASGSCGLTDGSAAGDWRLSNKKELISLVDFSLYNPSLPQGHPFAKVQSSNYCSANSYAHNTPYTLYVDMYHGQLFVGRKTSNYYFWPVRDGQPESANQPPILDPIGNKTGAEGQLLESTITATDPDVGDTMTFSASNLPEGATFDPETATFSWIPGYDQAGNYENVEFAVTDDGDPIEVDAELITITIGNINRPPEIIPVPPQSVLENELIQFSIVASDPDGDSIILSYGSLPEGAIFDIINSTFSWLPDDTQAGNYTVVFYATDGGEPNCVGQSEMIITVGDVLTPNEQTDLVIDSVINLGLDKEIVNSYLANFKKVNKFIDDGKITAAINQIIAFIKKVEQDISTANIDEMEGQSLVDSARNLLGLLSPNRLDLLINLIKRTEIGIGLYDYIDFLNSDGLIEIISLDDYGETFAGWLESQTITADSMICNFADIYIKLNEDVENNVELASTLIHEATHYRDAALASHKGEELNFGDSEIRAHANQYLYFKQAIEAGDYTNELYESLPDTRKLAMEMCYNSIIAPNNVTKDDAINALITKGYPEETLNITVTFTCVQPY